MSVNIVFIFHYNYRNKGGFIMSLVYLLIAILVIMAMILLMSKRRALARCRVHSVGCTCHFIYLFFIQIPSVAKLQYLYLYSIATSSSWIINLDLHFRWFKLNVFSYYFTYWNCRILLCNSIFILLKDNLPRFST